MYSEGKTDANNPSMASTQEPFDVSLLCFSVRCSKRENLRLENKDCCMGIRHHLFDLLIRAE